VAECSICSTHEEDADLATCSECGRFACYECIDWACDDDDQDCGDWVCDECIIPAQDA
jgi:hypothetical protein